MANLPISGLTASAANLAAVDLLPVVQTVGVGPVKMTGQQLAGGLLGSTSITGATVTTSQPLLNLTQTWNAGAVTFTGLRFNATDTASASASLLLDLQTGGVSQFSVTKAGIATSISLVSGNTALGNNSLAVSTTGNVIMWNGANFGFSSSGSVTSGSSIDAIIRRAAAASLQLGAVDAAAPVAQTLGVQSVVAGTSNTAGVNFTIKGSAGTGTGAGGSIIFQVAPAGSSGTAQNAFSTALAIDSNGLLQFAGTTSSFPAFKRSSASLQARLADDSNYAAFAAAAIDAYGNITLRGGTEATRRLTWNGIGAIRAQSDGVFTWLNDAATDFGRLQFGGTTSSFPALKRSSATLQVRLADDSAFAQLTASSVLAAGATGVIGYTTGSGGAVTQATSRTTGVTLNKSNGQITLVSAAGTATWQSFTVTNSTVAATDTIIVNQDSGTDLYQIFVTNVAAGSFQITFATTGGTTTEQPVFGFAVIKAVTS